MVINFVLPSIGYSGGIDVVYKYVNLLKNRGHDVRVYKELKASNMHRYTLKEKNLLHQIYCTVKACAQKDKKKYSEDYYVWKITNRFVRDADVIIATAWPTAYKVSVLSASKGRKFYFIQDYEVWDNEDWVKKSYMLPLHKIVISTWINNCLKRDLGIGSFPIVYNGLDTKLYHPVEVKKENDEMSFLMLNHTLPKKGIMNGLKAFENIKKKYPKCKLRMFGMCDNSNLPQHVEYYQNPPRDKLITLYSLSEFFIFPSLEEGWGLTPLEAMACGCIVFGTYTGFTLDLGRHRENMMLSQPGDISGMIENMEEVLKSPLLIDKIRENAYKMITKLNWEKAADKMVECLLQDDT